MKLFVLEYVSGGGLNHLPPQSIPDSWIQEGQAMLRALCEDASKIAEVATVATDRIAAEPINGVRFVPFQASTPALQQWIDHAQRCDAAIVVAPETDNLLIDTISAFRQSNVRVLACSIDVLRLSGDKFAFADWMRSNNFAHPETIALDQFKQSEHDWKSVVIKPRDGCGSDRVRKLRGDEVQAFASEVDAHEFIVQPLHDGCPASISAVVTPTQIHWLPAVCQHLTADNMKYDGGSGPLPPDSQAVARAITQPIVQRLRDEIAGYVSFDLVLGSSSDGCSERDSCVIEMNPRVTTSYIGLRHLVNQNLIAAMLDRSRSIAPNNPPKPVRWTPTGIVTKP